MPRYVAESFTASEADVLRRYFTNLDQPVFALVNLPEVVKGALFARYSRTHKSLRRLFLDEFVNALDLTGHLTPAPPPSRPPPPRPARRRARAASGIFFRFFFFEVGRPLGGPARWRPPCVRA